MCGILQVYMAGIYGPRRGILGRPVKMDLNPKNQIEIH